ncbi:MAG: DUF2924 domain-containing protein [Alphaproteobacteria bacterium]|nr:MAG: DUF2924 domain-containing protein [Alphaproteobacteria bacterium]
MADIAAEIDALHRMTTGELAERYEALHGRPTRTRHRAYLIRKITWRIQAKAEGDLTERARRRAAELADDAEIRVMAPKTLICPPQPGNGATVSRPLPNGEQNDPRLPPPGSAIVRQYKGRTIRVVVLAAGEGFEHDGERYRTLSAIAKKVTGSHINGFRFFRLGSKR